MLLPPPAPSAAISVPEVRVVLPPRSSATVRHISQVLARYVAERCATRIVSAGAALPRVELALGAGLGAEGFEIADTPSGSVRVTGGGERGLLYGVGKLLHTSRFDRGVLEIGAWRGRSAPRKPLRGIYLATHFHNYYHDAPNAEVRRYVEDLALWGYNTVVVWYDMHHFAAYDDREAAAFRERLRGICAAARRVGLDVGLGVIANEGYSTSPPGLRADRRAQRGGWYDCQVCPSRPEGLQYILGVFERLFAWAADLQPALVWIWPYDQGGCGCDACRPWGSRGFLTAARPLARLARRMLPGVRIIASTWYMDEAEVAALSAGLRAEPWADYVLVEGGPQPDVPALPVLGFPEISMHEMWPWGGFGATPLPAHFQRQWAAVRDRVAGGFPYSEGVYEDINKVLFAQYYWRDAPAEGTLREYIACEFSPDVVDEVLGILHTLEANHHMRWWPGELDGVKLTLDWFPSRGVAPQPDPGAAEAFAAAQRVDAALGPQARVSWRWRQLYLRALLDAELKRNHGAPNGRCREAFAELTRIYHAQRADPTVRPPVPP